MRWSVENLFQIDPNNFIARFCHNLYWFAKDLRQENQSIKSQELDQILEMFYPIFKEDMRNKAEVLVKNITATRQANGKVVHSHEFTPAVWSFNFEHFKRNILSVSLPN